MARYEIRDCWLEGETFNGIYLSEEAIEQAEGQLRDGVTLYESWVEAEGIGTVTLTDQGLIVEVPDGYPGLPAAKIRGSVETVDDQTMTVTGIEGISYFLTDGESGARIVIDR